MKNTGASLALGKTCVFKSCADKRAPALVKTNVLKGFWDRRVPGLSKNLCFHRFLGPARPWPRQILQLLLVLGGGAPPAIAKPYVFIGVWDKRAPGPCQNLVFS